ncbi:MAG: hypothetical protein ACHQIH_05350 [Ignavibacteria bacterium]
MIKLVMKYVLLSAAFISLSYCQDPDVTNRSGQLEAGNSLLNNSSKNVSLSREENPDAKIIPVLYRYSTEDLKAERMAKEERSFNIVSSFRGNIRFGGFWDKYAIINFTPVMYIKPFEFLSIYANHNLSYFVPVKAAAEHFKLMAIQSTAVLAIDNFVKHLLPASSIVKSICSFALKNLVIFCMKKPVIEGGSDHILEFDQLYYSLSVNF